MLQGRFTYFEWLVRATARAENAIFIRETASKHPPQNFSASVCATECFPLLPYPVRGLTEYSLS